MVRALSMPKQSLTYALRSNFSFRSKQKRFGIKGTFNARYSTQIKITKVTYALKI
jgi:hypothetical protein